MIKPDCSERSQQLLKVLVEKYIREGRPVGSKTLSEESILQLSPATIRNIMAELEDHGLVASPHTSAGRVPTALGYRLFVDQLLTISPLEEERVDYFKEALGADKTPSELVASASKLLSEMTRMAGIVTVPKRDQAVLSHIEFLPLSGNRMLTILVINEQEVQNRIIHVDRDYSPEALQAAGNYINQHCTGAMLSEVRERILSSMKRDKEHMDQMMESMLTLASDMLEPKEKDDGDYIVSGEVNLLPMADEAGIEKLQELFNAFAKKRDVLHLMDLCLKADGIQIFIGQESGYRPFDDCSVVSAPYLSGKASFGALAVIGPTRMPYQKVIPVVDVAAKILSATLNQS